MSVCSLGARHWKKLKHGDTTIDDNEVYSNWVENGFPQLPTTFIQVLFLRCKASYGCNRSHHLDQNANGQYEEIVVTLDWPNIGEFECRRYFPIQITPFDSLGPIFLVACAGFHTYMARLGDWSTPAVISELEDTGEKGAAGSET